MVPVLLPVQLGQEIAACSLLGAAMGAVRAFFPVRGRWAFVPDILLMGGLLLAGQSYAACLSADGVLRWYLLAGEAAGAAAADLLLGRPMRMLGRCLCRCLPRPKPQKPREQRPAEKRVAKKPKKNLPTKRRMLYNSNVSK
mgnify:CR=1 FL=1